VKLFIDYPARLATVTLEEGETQVDLAGLDAFTQRAFNEPVGLMALELIVPAGDHHSEELRKRNFVIAGNLSIDNTVFMRMRKTLSAPSFADTPRSTYCPAYNPDLATAAPVLQRTPAETSALKGLDKGLQHHYSDSAIEKRVREIQDEAAKFKSPRDEARDIQAKANLLARAIMKSPEGD